MERRQKQKQKTPSMNGIRLFVSTIYRQEEKKTAENPNKAGPLVCAQCNK